MHVRKLISMFSLFMVLGSQAVFQTNQVYAKWGCCGCACKYLTSCNCPGEGGCAWYPCSRHVPSPSIQTKVLIGNNLMQPVRGNPGPQTSLVLRPTSIDRLIQFPSLGQCAIDSFTQRFFQHSEDRIELTSEYLTRSEYVYEHS